MFAISIASLTFALALWNCALAEVPEPTLLGGRQVASGSHLHPFDLRVRQTCLVACGPTTCCNTGGPCIPSGGCCPAGGAVCPDGFGCCPTGVACTVNANGDPVCNVPCTSAQVSCGSSCCQPGLVCGQLQGRPICRDALDSPPANTPPVNPPTVSPAPANTLPTNQPVPSVVSVPPVNTFPTSPGATDILPPAEPTIGPTVPGTGDNSLVPNNGITSSARSTPSVLATTSSTSTHIVAFSSGGVRVGYRGIFDVVMAGVVLGAGLRVLI
jgi:hypothetical protein